MSSDRPSWLQGDGFCGGGGNRGLQEPEMAEIITLDGLHLWLIAHTFTQAELSISDIGLTNNLPMDAVVEENRSRRSPTIQIYPREIFAVVRKLHLSRKKG